MGIKEYRATGGNAALLKDYHRKSDSLAQWIIQFDSIDNKQVYGFDKVSNNKGIYSGSEYYPYLSANYDLRYKSIECGKTDKVKVDFGSYLEKDSIIFKDKYGVQYKLADGNILNFTGVAKADTNYIYAYRGDQKLGKLSVNTYKRKTYKVVLVSVNEATLPDINELKEYLGKIYRQCVDTFEIETDTLSVNDLFPFSHGDKNRFSGYNDDQKRVLKAYDSRINPDINYLFFIPDGAETNGVAGYNPLGYNFGFIYFGAGNRTIAHELAHGIASLNHPFKDEVETKGQTDNLLDYNDGTSLWHFQWDNLQNPPSRIFKWNFEEEDAEGVEKIDTLICFKIKGNKTKEYEYKNGDLFATMHTNDKITIEIISKDTTLNIRKLSWFFDKNRLSFTDSLNNKVELTLDEKTISLKGNSLSVKDSLNKEIASLKFQAYLPPYVEFSIDDKTYNGEFLFDDSFRRINKSSIEDKTNYYKQYQTITTSDHTIKYIPVMGVCVNKTGFVLATIKTPNLAEQDKNFLISFKSEDGKLQINGSGSVSFPFF